MSIKIQATARLKVVADWNSASTDLAKSGLPGFGGHYDKGVAVYNEAKVKQIQQGLKDRGYAETDSGGKDCTYTKSANTRIRFEHVQTAHDKYVRITVLR